MNQLLNIITPEEIDQAKKEWPAPLPEKVFVIVENVPIETDEDDVEVDEVLRTEYGFHTNQDLLQKKCDELNIEYLEIDPEEFEEGDFEELRFMVVELGVFGA